MRYTATPWSKSVAMMGKSTAVCFMFQSTHTIISHFSFRRGIHVLSGVFESWEATTVKSKNVLLNASYIYKQEYAADDTIGMYIQKTKHGGFELYKCLGQPLYVLLMNENMHVWKQIYFSNNDFGFRSGPRKLVTNIYFVMSVRVIGISIIPHVVCEDTCREAFEDLNKEWTSKDFFEAYFISFFANATKFARVEVCCAAFLSSN